MLWRQWVPKSLESEAWASLLSCKQTSVALLNLALVLLRWWLSLPEAHPYIIALVVPTAQNLNPSFLSSSRPFTIPMALCWPTQCSVGARPDPSLLHMGWAPHMRGGHGRWLVCVCMPKCGNPRDGSELGVRQGLQLLFFLGAVILQTPAQQFPWMEHSFSLFLNLCCSGPAGVLPALEPFTDPLSPGSLASCLSS